MMNKIISEWLIMENKINIYIFFRILNLKCVMFIYYFDSYIYYILVMLIKGRFYDCFSFIFILVSDW